MYTPESVGYAIGLALMFLAGASGLAAAFWRRKPPDEETRRWREHYQHIWDTTAEAIQTQQAAEAGLRDITGQEPNTPQATE